MGILEFVFGKSAPKDDTAPKQAYYLSDDDAKTFGNIDYMREMKTVEHKFPNGKRKTQVRKISSVDYLKLDNQIASRGTNFTTTPSKPATSFNTAQTSFGKPQSSFSSSSSSTPSTSASSESKPKEQEAEKRRPADNSMDMFRSMAKNIRK